MASWLGNFFTGNNTTTDSTTSATGGTFAGVGQTTPSILPYTTPTTHIVGPTPTTHTTGYVSTTSTTSLPTGGLGIGVHNPNQQFVFSSSGTYNPGTIHIAGTNPTISTDKGKIELNALIELVDILKERLLILTPNFEKMEKYAALKKAYDHYKLMESMIGDDDVNK